MDMNSLCALSTASIPLRVNCFLSNGTPKYISDMDGEGRLTFHFLVPCASTGTTTTNHISNFGSRRSDELFFAQPSAQLIQQSASQGYQSHGSRTLTPVP